MGVIAVRPGAVAVVVVGSEALVVATVSATVDLVLVVNLAEVEVEVGVADGVVGTVVAADVPPSGKAAEDVDLVLEADPAAGGESAVVPEVAAVVVETNTAADDVVAVVVEVLAAVVAVTLEAANDDDGADLRDEGSIGPEVVAVVVLVVDPLVAD